MRADGGRLAGGVVAAALALGLACERGQEAAGRSLVCPSPERVTRLRDVHYQGVGCADAVASAESTLTAGYFRKACEQLAPREGLPARVSDAFVSRCEADPEPGTGSILQIEVCCP